MENNDVRKLKDEIGEGLKKLEKAKKEDLLNNLKAILAILEDYYNRYDEDICINKYSIRNSIEHTLTEIETNELTCKILALREKNQKELDEEIVNLIKNNYKNETRFDLIENNDNDNDEDFEDFIEDEGKVGKEENLEE